ncbi:MAG: hypothetical protein ACO1TE_18715 [Prosthecobacter sp.]
MPRILRQTLLLLSAPALALSAPGFESLSPAGGKAGTTFEVKVAGKGLDKGGPQGWCSNPGVKITPAPGAKPGSGLWSIEIAKDAAPGPCLVRFFHDEGATPPRIFEVGTLEEFTEAEPNDAFKDAKSAASSSAPDAKAAPRMNATLNGVLAKEGDADTWALRVQKGKAITLELHGYSLGSSMDPAMRLLDARGVELASSHDTHNLDPVIRHTPAADGVLYAQVFAFVHPPQADIAFKGTANHIYRLHVIDSAQSSSSSTPGAPPTPKDSKDTKDSASTSLAPFTLHGIISAPTTEATHLLTAKKGDDLRIAVRAKAIRSPLEALLRIESADGSGKILAQNDDAESISSGNSATALDPSLHWKAPADGTYKLVISDRFQNGSPDHRYELSVQPWKPSVTAVLDTHAYRVEPGKTAEIKLTVKFDGTYPDKLRARATGLPPGLTAAEVEVPAKGGEVKLTLKAAADAAPAQVPFSVELVPVPAAPPKAESKADVAKPETKPKSKAEAEASTATPPAAAPIPAASPPVVPAATATYAIPFTELRGDLLIVSDARPWLTVPKGKESAAKKAEKDKAAKP